MLIGLKIPNKYPEKERTNNATRLTCTPGVSPVKIPINIPNIKAISICSNINSKKGCLIYNDLFIQKHKVGF